jgi:hypothetical protein
MDVYRALADPTRRVILDAFRKRKGRWLLEPCRPSGQHEALAPGEQVSPESRTGTPR